MRLSAPAGHVLHCGVTFNGWAGNRDWRGNLDELRDDVERRLGLPVDVIATQETKNWSGTIHGFERVDALSSRWKRHPEAPSTVLHVARRHEIVRERFVAVVGKRAEWIGPKHGLLHHGRIHVGATIQRPEGLRVDELAGHHVWGWKRNPEAYAFDTHRTAHWMLRMQNRHPGRAIHVREDFNGGKLLPVHDGPTDLARRTGFRVALHGVDGALVFGAPIVASVRMPGRYGGDGHHAVATVTAIPLEQGRG